MILKIISSHETLFKGEAESVTLPGEVGSFTVLRNHASLISVLVKGKVVFRDNYGKEFSYDIRGGLADIDNNVVSVCVY